MLLHVCCFLLVGETELFGIVSCVACWHYCHKSKLNTEQDSPWTEIDSILLVVSRSASVCPSPSDVGLVLVLRLGFRRSSLCVSRRNVQIMKGKKHKLSPACSVLTVLPRNPVPAILQECFFEGSLCLSSGLVSDGEGVV